MLVSWAWLACEWSGLQIKVLSLAYSVLNIWAGEHVWLPAADENIIDGDPVAQ